MGVTPILTHISFAILWHATVDQNAYPNAPQSPENCNGLWVRRYCTAPPGSRLVRTSPNGFTPGAEPGEAGARSSRDTGRNLSVSRRALSAFHAAFAPPEGRVASRRASAQDDFTLTFAYLPSEAGHRPFFERGSIGRACQQRKKVAGSLRCALRALPT